MLKITGAGPMKAPGFWTGGRRALPAFVRRHQLPLSLLCEACLILWMSAHGDFLLKGEAGKFTALGVAACIPYWIAAQSSASAALSGKRTAAMFWLSAIGLRLCILPVLAGDDVWRYRWEGMIQLHGFNPYRLGPDAPALAYLRDVGWPKINHREYAAIYPPLTEALFAGMAALGNSIWAYKALFALADLGCVAVLRKLLARSGMAAGNAAWYAWNPLVIYASAGAAHFDCLMVLALLGAISALDGFVRGHQCPGPGGRSAWPSAGFWISACLLGVGGAIKLVPLALLPVWAFAGRSWRRAFALAPLALAPLALSAAAYGFPRAPVFATLRQFANTFQVNAPVWWLAEALSRPPGPPGNRLYLGCALTACLALACWWRRDWRRAVLWVPGAFLLLSPVVHAWYLIWVLPLAAWRGARAWFVFSGSMFGYFLLWEVNHASGRPWEEPLWLRGLIFLPPLAALFMMKAAGSHPARSGGSPPPNPVESRRFRDELPAVTLPGTSDGPVSSRRGRRIALILPACHEEETITPVLDELLGKLDPRWEWIVAVGVNGSPAGQDRTAELARLHPLSPVVAETPLQGYGHGCQAAIDRCESLGLAPDAFIFFAADGANDPHDLPRLLEAHAQGSNFVLGCRTARALAANLAVMGWPHVLANRFLGAWCGLLSRSWFRDIGPLRLIERKLFHRLRLREWTFGWTIEAQVVAARLGARMTEVPMRERRRLAGAQKVSKVNWRRTLSIGWQIALAGWRASRRPLLAAKMPPAPMSCDRSLAACVTLPPLSVAALPRRPRSEP